MNDRQTVPPPAGSMNRASGRSVRVAALAFAALLIATAGLRLRAAPARPPAGHRNLIENGGFERGVEGWETGQGQVLIQDEKQARSGQACLFGEITAPNRHWQLTKTVKVSARNLYEFEIWARATNRTKLVLWVVKPGAKQRTMANAWERVTAKWRRYTIPVTVGQDGDLKLNIIAPSSHGAPPGKMWLDDIALYETVMPAVASVTQDTGFNDEPALARAGDGSLYLAWNNYRDGSDSLRVARMTRQEGADAFTKSSEWEAVPRGEKTFVLHPHVVGTDTGAVLLYAGEVAENDWDVFAVTLTPAGPSPPVPVTRGKGVDVKPFGIWNDGVLWVAWESNRTGSRRVYLTSLRGQTASAAEPVSADGCSNYSPTLAVLEGGVVCVAWHSFREHNYDIYLRRRQTSGTWGVEMRLTQGASVDRHAKALARARELWVAYENAQTGGYRIGSTGKRRLVVARVAEDGSLSAPPSLPKSPLYGRCEAASPAFDQAGRLWIAHLRPRGRRAGWDAFLIAYTGDAWSPLRRVSARVGMDRRPAMVLAGERAIVACQAQTALRAFPNPEDSAKETSNIVVAEADLSGTPPATAMDLAPLAEPGEPFEASQIRQERGDDTSEVPTIQYNGQELKLVYGDLHEHTDVSQCNRLGDQSIDESYQHMRDIVSLDFAAVTDHGYNITPYLWNYTAKLARVNHDPGEFLTFLGEEWTSTFEEYSEKHPYGFHGHRNLIMADAYFPAWWNAKDRKTPADLWRELRAMDADFIQIPHQLADTGNVPTDWDYIDEVAQPVAEMLQVRGSYEYKGTHREAKRTTPAGYFMQDAWARGIVIGVIASPDHGGGIGKACVFTPELTREGILDAMRARHCFGTSAARMFLDVRVNGHLMGEKIPAAKGDPVKVDVIVRCPAEIDRVEICRSNEFIYSKRPDGEQTTFTFTDTDPLDTPSYYYVRVIQKDDEVAWSSPVWLGYP